MLKFRGSYGRYRALQKPSPAYDYPPIQRRLGFVLDNLDNNGADSVEMLATLQQDGKIRHVGLSNVTIAQIVAARQILPIASVQNRFSITERDHEDVINWCTQHNIAFIPYGSLGAHPLKSGAPLASSERHDAS